MTDSPEGTPAAENPAPHAVSRRRLFGAVGAGAVLAGAGAVIGRVTADQNSGTDHADVVAFRGEHQAGITTPAQDRMHFVAFDVTTKSRDELITLLQTWTAMAERMTAGQEATEDGATGDGPYAPPSDTGEALDLAPSQLTLTIGFGPSLFDDRFGLADKKPAALLDLPHFRADNLDPNRSGRHRHPSVRQRSPGCRPCDPQPRASRVRDRVGQMVTTRIRTNVLDLDDAGDTTKSVRVQGRNSQHQGRRPGRTRPARLG